MTQREQHGGLGLPLLECGLDRRLMFRSDTRLFEWQRRLDNDSDESTTSYAVKMAGTDIETTPGGHVGIETRGIIGFSEGVGKRGFSLHRFVEVFSTNPARVTGLYPRKGVIAPGSNADVVVRDPDDERTITIDQLHHDGDYSPWDGWRVCGWPQTTILRGRIAVDRGDLFADPRGIFVPRKIEPDVLARPAF